ncbi:hypothetical protein ACFL5K_04035, partial [Gemmatimonadota bacterium]
AMARLFSGPEDTWIKNESGEWIKHGHPSGPPPTQNYQEPLRVTPFAFMIAFAVPLFFLSRHKLHNRLNFDNASRDIKFFGYISTALIAFGIMTGTGLLIEVTFIEGNTGDLGGLEFLVLNALGGISGLCILLGFQFFVLKRNCNDHYQLEKSRRELMEMLENLVRH